MSDGVGVGRPGMGQVPGHPLVQVHEFVEFGRCRVAAAAASPLREVGESIPCRPLHGDEAIDVHGDRYGSQPWRHRRRTTDRLPGPAGSSRRRRCCSSSPRQASAVDRWRSSSTWRYGRRWSTPSFLGLGVAGFVLGETAVVVTLIATVVRRAARVSRGVRDDLERSDAGQDGRRPPGGDRRGCPGPFPSRGHPVGSRASSTSSSARAASPSSRALATRQSQRLGDLAAGTIVIRERQAAAFSQPIVFHPPPGWEPYGAALDVSALSDEGYILVRSFLLRVDDLRPEARAERGADLATAVARPHRRELPGRHAARTVPDHGGRGVPGPPRWPRGRRRPSHPNAAAVTGGARLPRCGRTNSRRPRGARSPGAVVAWRAWPTSTTPPRRRSARKPGRRCCRGSATSSATRPAPTAWPATPGEPSTMPATSSPPPPASGPATSSSPRAAPRPTTWRSTACSTPPAGVVVCPAAEHHAVLHAVEARGGRIVGVDRHGSGRPRCARRRAGRRGRPRVGDDGEQRDRRHRRPRRRRGRSSVTGRRAPWSTPTPCRRCAWLDLADVGRRRRPAVAVGPQVRRAPGRRRARRPRRAHPCGRSCSAAARSAGAAPARRTSPASSAPRRRPTRRRDETRTATVSAHRRAPRPAGRRPRSTPIDGSVETAVADGDRSGKVAGNCHVCIPGVEAETLLVLLEDATSTPRRRRRARPAPRTRATCWPRWASTVRWPGQPPAVARVVEPPTPTSTSRSTPCPRPSSGCGSSREQFA